jgi:flagellar biosynthesis protein FliQ
MTPEFVTSVFLQAIKTAILLAAPMLLSGLAVGILISLFQAATQINEMTMTFIPKMLVVAVALLLFFPWMIQTMIDFVNMLYTSIPAVVRG